MSGNGFNKVVDEELYRIRHSLAHILAMAVQEYRPGTKLGFGPPIEDGFYYDFILPETINDEDFKSIEKIMRRLIQTGVSFEREELNKAEAYKRLGEMGEPYKKEYAEELVEKKDLKGLTFYRSGNFIDMCDGPHVTSSKEIKSDCFKIKSVAGAYWRGNSDNMMMTRLYVWAFKTKEELVAHIKNYELSLLREHKKLGRELDLFFIDEMVGKGLPMWTPAGTVLRDELEKLAKEMEFKDRYYRVHTPELAKAELYYKTGHLPYYAEGMYPMMDVGTSQEMKEGDEVEKYCLRPMNCPHHHRIFGNKPRSYRDLPLRLAEYGKVFRYEDSGALSGLLRVRGFCQNDAHIYCTPEQVFDEFVKVIELHQNLYKVLGIKDFYMRLSCWDPADEKGKDKYAGEAEEWAVTEEYIRKALIHTGIDYVEVKGEAAFYGPKMDVQIRSVTGREETAGTCQLDFVVPERLGLTYTDADNEEKHPYVIHRAPLGSHERFVAFLIEHYGGAFPTWFAPVQVMIVPVGEKYFQYAREIDDLLRGEMIRSEVDCSDHTLNKKIRTHSKGKIPNIVIVGEKEEETKSVTWRKRGVEQQESLDLEQFKNEIMKKIATRQLD